MDEHGVVHIKARFTMNLNFTASHSTQCAKYYLVQTFKETDAYYDRHKGNPWQQQKASVYQINHMRYN